MYTDAKSTTRKTVKSFSLCLNVFDGDGFEYGYSEYGGVFECGTVRAYKCGSIHAWSSAIHRDLDTARCALLQPPPQNNWFPDSYWEMSCLNPHAAGNYVVGCTGTITFRPNAQNSYLPADMISFSLQYLDESAFTLAGTVTGTNGAKNLNDMWLELATSDEDYKMNLSYKKGKGWNPFNKYQTEPFTQGQRSVVDAVSS